MISYTSALYLLQLQQSLNKHISLKGEKLNEVF